MYKETAEKMYGILKVSAIECEDEEELCEDFGVYSHPTIMVFSENFNDDGEVYKGGMDQK